MSTSHGDELTSGDIAFEYEPRHSNVNLLLFGNFITYALLFGIIKIAAYFENKYLLFLSVIPIVVMFWIVKRTLTRNENRKREKEAALDALSKDKIAEIYNDGKVEKTTCKKVEYYVEKNGFGNYVRRLLALMSDDNVISFKVVQRNNGLENEKWYLTIRRRFELVTDYKTCSRVLSYKDKLRWLSPERNALVALLFILFIWIVLTAIFAGLIFWLRGYMLVAIVSILILQAILLFINQYVHIPKFIFDIVNFPINIKNLWIKFTAPVLALLFGLFSIVFINSSLIVVLYGIYWVYMDMPQIPESLNMELLVFIGLSAFSIFSVFGNKWIMLFYESIGLLSVVESKSLKQPILGLAEYVYQRQNINVVIYALYLAFFAITSYLHFVYNDECQYLFSKGIDDSIAKAFLLHIAFTNLVAKRKESQFKISEFRDRLWEILTLRE